VLEIMEHFISHQSVVSNESVREEGTLILTNDLREDDLQPVGDRFSDDFVNNIA
jgi:hypothetical protein